MRVRVQPWRGRRRSSGAARSIGSRTGHLANHLLYGGAALASTLFEAGVVDEVIVKRNPILFGSGIPLLARAVPAIALELQELRRFPSGHAWLQYRVRRWPATVSKVMNATRIAMAKAMLADRELPVRKGDEALHVSRATLYATARDISR